MMLWNRENRINSTGLRSGRAPGVLLIQVDGLSRRQLEAALKAGRMPFLRRLLRGGNREFASFYPGQPTCTPAVQAELYFGVPSAVPAFGFFDPEKRRLVRMYEADATAQIARDVGEGVSPLLEGGASYGNTYTGGARKAKYCGELNTIEHWSSELSIFRLLRVIYRRPVGALRLMKWLLIELWLGIGDCVRGTLARGQLRKELTFILARLAVGIALREAIKREVKHDLEKGLPIIHANFLGYDEFSHRRGPRSRFAHGALRGIDRSIRELFIAARKSRRREYQTIVFSDHGQESVIPYVSLMGKSLEQVTDEFFGGDAFCIAPECWQPGIVERSKNFVNRIVGTAGQEEKRLVYVCSLGPVAHVYLVGGLSELEKAEWARRYCVEGWVPLVLYRDTLEDIICFTASGPSDLTELRKRLEARGHPFAREVAKDLRGMLISQYAGDLVLLGWRDDGPPITFAVENGAHGGPGIEESHGFALLPRSVGWGRHWLRPSELREIAFSLLGREQKGAPALIKRPPKRFTPIRVMTYNVHGGVGVDRRKDMRRLTSVIGRLEPDIVCFQEAFEPAGGNSPSLGEIMSWLWREDCHYRFLELHRKRGAAYGLAIASKWPFHIKKTIAFEIDDALLRHREPRGAMWVECESKGYPIQIINTHFGLNAYERLVQVATLLGSDWIGSAERSDNLIVTGDLNAGPRSEVYRLLRKELADAQVVACNGFAQGSFLSWAPVWRVDHIFVGKVLTVRTAGVFDVRAARYASDHLPVFADLEPRSAA